MRLGLSQPFYYYQFMLCPVRDDSELIINSACINPFYLKNNQPLFIANHQLDELQNPLTKLGYKLSKLVNIGSDMLYEVIDNKYSYGALALGTIAGAEIIRTNHQSITFSAYRQIITHISKTSL